MPEVRESVRSSHNNAGAEFRLIQSARDAMDHAESLCLPQGMDTPRGGWPCVIEGIIKRLITVIAYKVLFVDVSPMGKRFCDATLDLKLNYRSLESKVLTRIAGKLSVDH
ncbi:hypothetical protein AVEN_36242-1 [Araneus ventricosus]|uniref:Uncharacterized protein n=1 Tax=Araneus ventricosus TaxID=182803 RepID=A0A4Y2J8I9_ARAVE|nr:hypothetical protein AVEN_36242-1 [Araneus ventricosus]